MLQKGLYLKLLTGFFFKTEKVKLKEFVPDYSL